MKNKFSIAMSLALMVAMLVTSFALADNLVTDGDGLVPVGEITSLNLGDVCQAGTASSSVYLLIKRTGGGNVYDDSATVSLSAVTTASVSNLFSDGTIVLPEDWTDLGNTAFSSDTARSTITVSAAAAEVTGAKTGSIEYSATGGEDGSTGSLTRKAKIDLSWNVVTCAPVVQNQAINVTTPAPAVATYGSSFNVAATATSGLPVAITTSGVCSGSGSGSAIISMTSGTGTCTVHYNQAGNLSFNAAPEVTSDTTAQKANATVTLSDLSHTYDGTTKSASASTTPPGLSVNITYDGSATAPTNAGDYDVVATINDVNYAGSASDTLQIAKATANCSVTGYSVTYDGAAHTATGSCTGVGGPADVLSGLDLNGTTHTNAGSYTDSWTFTDVTGNYNDATGSVDNSIAKADADCSVTGYSVTYDGAAHTATGSCTGVGGPADVLSGLDLNGTTHTNAGSYTDSWTFTDVTGNYNDATGSVDNSIAKADADCSVTGYSVIYDGAPHTATGSCTGVLGEVLAGLDLSGTTHINAGSYTDSWTFTDVTGNYNDASGTVQDNIHFAICALYDQTKSHKLGSTVPVKLQLCDAYGVNQSSASTVVHATTLTRMDTLASGVVDDSGAANSPTLNFRYDATLGGSGGYIFNLSTKGLSKGTWKLTFTVDGVSDPSYFVLFDVK